MKQKQKNKNAALFTYKQHVSACRVRRHGKRRKPLGLAVWLRLYDLPCVFCGKVKPLRSIDRIDSRRGYMPDNVQPACVDHNLMKSDHTDADFIALCAQVTCFRGKRS